MQTRKKKPRLVEAEKAYQHWEKHDYLSQQDLCNMFKIQRDDIRDWMKANGKSRPDGQVRGKDSPRQVAIREAYDLAVKGGHDIGWALKQLRQQGSTAGKGDIRYYAMKAGLPDLPEVPTNRLTSSKYG